MIPVSPEPEETGADRRPMPEYVIRLTHDVDDLSRDVDDRDLWEVLQRCIGVDYYVTLGDFETLEEAEAAIVDFEQDASYS